jgi:hypothetical protein
MCRGPYAGTDYNLTLCPLQNRLQHIYHGQHVPESTLTLCPMLYPPFRDFGFGLRIVLTVLKLNTEFFYATGALPIFFLIKANCQIISAAVTTQKEFITPQCKKRSDLWMFSIKDFRNVLVEKSEKPLFSSPCAEKTDLVLCCQSLATPPYPLHDFHADIPLHFHAS